jgi:alpha-glucosidase
MPTPVYRTFDPFQTLTDAHDRVLLHTGRGPIELTPTAPGVLRVRTSRRRRLPAYQSHAVLPAAGPAPESRLEPSATGTRLSFDGLALEISFEPVRLRLLRPTGEPAAEFELGQRTGTLVARARLDPAAAVYGLGEKTGWLDKRHRRYSMRNTDVLLDRPEGIGIATDPMYASLPVFAVHSLAGTYGVYLDQTEFTTFDFTGDTYEFASPSDTCTFYLLAGPTLPDVVRQYTGLTGRAPLPPLWALGYHQSRWGYRSEADFRAIAAELRRRRLPADALWFDIDYMDGFRVFTWNKPRFPRPAHLIADLKKDGFQSVTIVDPGVKVDPDYALYQEGQASGHFLRHPDGREYNANVWPGLSAFPDFHDPSARAWWSKHVADWQAQSGVAGIWNDMNEPAGTDVSGPVNEVLHAGGTLPHRSARNAYGLYMARATYAGLLARDPNIRPFILTRAAFSGAQAVTALWGGDNTPHWEHLSGSLPLLMNLGLSGLSFVGVDIGGFAGDVTAELLARWFQAGAFYPFCRNHAMLGANAHEPWAFGPEVETIARRALELRYQLLPYFYNLFYENGQTGAPLMRPLVWHYPDDPLTFNLSDQFLLGRDLLVAPVMTPGQRARAVYLPEGRWYAWGSDAVLDGAAHHIAEAPLDTLPLYVRAGAMLPMWPVAQHTGAIQRDQLRLHFWPGSGQADYYEDDGATQGYTRGESRLTRFSWKAGGAGATLKWARSQGAYRAARDTWTFVFHALPGMKAELDGKPARSQREANVLLVTAPDDGQAHTLKLIHRGR